jgi:hypothetical protein
MQPMEHSSPLVQPGESWTSSERDDLQADSTIFAGVESGVRIRLEYVSGVCFSYPSQLRKCPRQTPIRR